MAGFGKGIKALLYPHIALLWLLTPTAMAGLILTFTVAQDNTVAVCVCYVLAAYVLTTWCCRIPRIVHFFRTLRHQNPLVKRWVEDVRFRMNVSLYGSLFWNGAYGLLQLWLAVVNRSFWYYSLACYYVLIAVMRFFLLRYVQCHRPGEQMTLELKKYRTCGWILLLMNLTLALMVFFMVYWNRSFVHHPIVTIAMAAYTFTAFTVAIVGLVRYRAYHSPAYAAVKTVRLVAACVSMLTLESAMLNAFGAETDALTRQGLQAATGAAVTAFTVTVAIFMIVRASRALKNKEQTDGQQPE